MAGVTVKTDTVTAMNLEVQKYDKLIAEAEATVADLKRQKASYIYDTNIHNLLMSQQAREAQSQPS